MRTFLTSAAAVLLAACGATPADIAFDATPPASVHTLDALAMPAVTVLDADHAAIEPAPAVVWTVTPADVASIEDGKLVLLSAGTVEVTATLGSLTESFTVAVTLPDELRIDSAAVTGPMTAGATAQLGAAVLAAGEAIADQPITWLSETPEVATVTEQGVVTAVAPGTARLVARSGGIENELAVVVEAPVVDEAALAAEGTPAE